MNTRLAVTMLLCAFGSVGSVAAQNAPVRGQGTIACSSWISDHRSETLVASAQNAWLMGFVSAYHAHSGVTPSESNADLIGWVTAYCRGHPNDTLYQAASALVAELSAKRP